MVQRINKKKKTKFNLTPVLKPLLYSEATETANIPMWQSDGSIKFTDVESLKLMIDNGLIEFTNPPS